METALPEKTKIHMSEKNRRLIFDIITFAFILLFAYTAASKFMTFASFVKVLGKSPVIGHFNYVIAYLIPAMEVILCLVLIPNSTKRLGLLLSLGLMVVFTVYLIYMVLLGGDLPCHCGGVISRMTWTQHIGFNCMFIAIALIGLKISKKHKKRIQHKKLIFDQIN